MSGMSNLTCQKAFADCGVASAWLGQSQNQSQSRRLSCAADAMSIVTGPRALYLAAVQMLTQGWLDTVVGTPQGHLGPARISETFVLHSSPFTAHPGYCCTPQSPVIWLNCNRAGNPGMDDSQYSSTTE